MSKPLNNICSTIMNGLFEEGEGYAVEPNVEHSVEMLEDSIAMDVFAPPRDENR